MECTQIDYDGLKSTIQAARRFVQHLSADRIYTPDVEFQDVKKYKDQHWRPANDGARESDSLPLWRTKDAVMKMQARECM